MVIQTVINVVLLGGGLHPHGHGVRVHPQPAGDIQPGPRRHLHGVVLRLLSAGGQGRSAGIRRLPTDRPRGRRIRDTRGEVPVQAHEGRLQPHHDGLHRPLHHPRHHLQPVPGHEGARHPLLHRGNDRCRPLPGADRQDPGLRHRRGDPRRDHPVRRSLALGRPDAGGHPEQGRRRSAGHTLQPGRHDRLSRSVSALPPSPGCSWARSTTSPRSWAISRSSRC